MYERWNNKVLIEEMPPKVDISLLSAKRDNMVNSLYELFEEFQVLYSVEADISMLENVYKQIETKYRLVRQQQDVIIDKILEGKISGTEEAESVLESNKKVGTQVKANYLSCTKSFAEYQRKCSSNKSEQSESIEAMTSAVTKMAEALISTKADKTNSLEKLSVPVWDGKRKTYLTWKHEFKYWMEKYKQDKEEQLQRFS